jgi:hypothetical protein
MHTYSDLFKVRDIQGLSAERRENATQSVQEPANPSQTTKYRRMYSCRGTSRIVLDYVLS